MKRKIGDKVRIKSREEIDRYLKENGDFESGWIDDMYIYCGMEAIIIDFDSDFELEGYILDIDSDGWAWTNEMFED